MTKGWTTTKLMAVGSLVALELVIELFTTLITISTGIPLSEGFVTIITGSIFAVCTLLLIDKFGTMVIYSTLYTILALPTNLWGPPGFFPKIIIGLSIGILMDLSYLLIKKTNLYLSLAMANLCMNFVGAILLVIFGTWLNIPGIEKTAALLYSPVIILAGISVTFLITFLGMRLFDRIKNTTVVKRIQG